MVYSRGSQFIADLKAFFNSYTRSQIKITVDTSTNIETFYNLLVLVARYIFGLFQVMSITNVKCSYKDRCVVHSCIHSQGDIYILLLIKRKIYYLNTAGCKLCSVRLLPIPPPLDINVDVTCLFGRIMIDMRAAFVFYKTTHLPYTRYNPSKSRCINKHRAWHP